MCNKLANYIEIEVRRVLEIENWTDKIEKLPAFI